MTRLVPWGPNDMNADVVQALGKKYLLNLDYTVPTDVVQ